MSFEIYVACYDKGEPAWVPGARVFSHFGTFASLAGPGLLRVCYDPLNSCDINFTTLGRDPNLISGLSVSRPCGDVRLFNALAAILASGNFVLYFPGCRAPLVARGDVAPHLPADMVASLGDARIVRSGAELQVEISGGTS